MLKRNIRFIVVHSTNTPQTESLQSLRKGWRKKLECDTPPFHYLVERDGTVRQLLHENTVTGGEFAYNGECLHIAFTGGMDKAGHPVDNRSGRQKEGLFNAIVELTTRYSNAEIVAPNEISGHFNPYPSPCFDVKKWLKEYSPNLSEQPFFESVEYIEEEAA